MSQCTEWLWYRNKCGYGTMRYGGRPGVFAHRVAFCIANGVTLSSIKGKEVRHKCDNPGCVNPDHLELGSHADNMADMAKRGRAAKGFKIARCVLSDEQVSNLKKDRETMTYKQLGDKYGISEAHACRICKNQRRAE